MAMPMQLRLSMLVALLLTFGCNGDDPASPPSIAGTYALISVDGDALPVTLDTGEGEFEILSGQFVVSDAGTCMGSITVREVGTTDTDVMANICTWARTGASIAIAWSDGPVDSGIIQGNRISFIAQEIMGLLLVFER